jgi:site-specific DNA-cytosine methylase
MSLGLEAAGMTTIAFCEREPAPRHWLSQHWGVPMGVPIYDDIRTLTGETLARDVGRIDIIAGGFPCTDISVAGRGAGLGTTEAPTERSGLWFEMLRLIREVRPRYVLAENVPALRTRGADVVLDGLAGAGYTAQAFVVGASDVGAPHRRKRVWIVARKRLADSDRARERDANELRGIERAGRTGAPDVGRGREGLGNTCGAGWAVGSLAKDQRGDVREERQATPSNGYGGGGLRWPARPGEPQHAWEAPRLAHTDSTRRAKAGGGHPLDAGREPEPGRGEGMGDTPSEPPRSRQEPDPRQPEPCVGDAVDGLPGRVAGLRTSYTSAQALKALGNAVVPPLVAAIGRAIMRMDQHS